MTPTGGEQEGSVAQFSRENSDYRPETSRSVVTPVVTSGAIDSDLQAIIDAWPKLSGATREALLTLIRDP